MTAWQVTFTREQTITDGQGAHQRSWTTRVLAYPVSTFEDETDARAYAARVLAASTDPTLEAGVSGPPAKAGSVHLDDATRTTGLAGVRNARKRLDP